MSSERRTNTPSRLLIFWIVGFLVIGVLASYTFFNLVREIVKTWNTTALAAPSAPAPVIDPQTGAPQMVIQDWQGVERVNILLLGIDEREQEQGPWRTDTMIVATVDPISKTAGLLSIPRDLWVAIPGFDTEGKINTAHFIGDLQNYPGGGPALAMATVQYNLGISTQYYARINFSGFEKLIDQIGGVDICVPETIDDPEYPDFSTYGFDPLHIDAGCQHMDGTLALKYARTRHSGAGDFDRARRQQQVMLAVRDKIVSANMLPTLVTQAGPLLDTLKESVQTNLSLDQLIQLASFATQIDPKNIQQAVIDENMTVGYMAPTDPPQAVLVPLRDKIRELRERFFNVGPVTGAAGAAALSARIKIENGTQISGLAAQTAQWLTTLGYTVADYTSADRFDYTQSVIINHTATLTAAVQLAQTLGLPITTVVTSTAPTAGFDLQIILGSDFEMPTAATQTP